MIAKRSKHVVIILISLRKVTGTMTTTMRRLTVTDLRREMTFLMLISVTNAVMILLFIKLKRR